MAPLCPSGVEDFSFLVEDYAALSCLLSDNAAIIKSSAHMNQESRSCGLRLLLLSKCRQGFIKRHSENVIVCNMQTVVFNMGFCFAFPAHRSTVVHKGKYIMNLTDCSTPQEVQGAIELPSYHSKALHDALQCL